MTAFISETTLSEAVDRLGESRAAPRLADYLIFKRALVRTTHPSAMSNGARERAGAAPRSQPPVPGRIITGTKSLPFVVAIDEMALCVPREQLAEWPHQPYFQPFGAKRDGARGYKSKKYPSNGPDNTAAGWQTMSNNPVRLVAGTSPREWEIIPRSGEEYSSFLLVRSAQESFSGERPRLLDAACWWLRFAAFEAAPSEADLVERFVRDLGLTQTELHAAFEPLGSDVVGFQATQASPNAYLPAAPSAGVIPTHAPARPSAMAEETSQATDLEPLISYIRSRGYVFEPWQVAAFITAARTKPFVILAGISGTGKTKMARLIAEATGAEFSVIPVQPNWTDSSDLLGFERLTGDFVPGRLLQFCKAASENPGRQHFVLLDEMNIARVEYYLAEVLSVLEERKVEGDRIVSPPLAPSAPGPWREIGLPENLCIVGSVNMDETTFGFSRKVLDRAFVIEFSSVDLGAITEAVSVRPPSKWEAERWRQPSLTLAAHPDRDNVAVSQAVTALEALNEALGRVQLQIGYRVRDEVAMFCIHAQAYADWFATIDESPIDPLDLAITMKVLPRIQGGGPAIRSVLTELLSWANGARGTDRPTAGTGTAFPMCVDRLQVMDARLRDTGFTSYWL